MDNWSKFILIFFFATALVQNCLSQQKDTAIVLAIEGKQVFLDLGADDVHEKAVFTLNQTNFFVHPVTGEKIFRKDKEKIFVLIGDVFEDYSEATIYGNATSPIEPGTKLIRVNEDFSNLAISKKVTVLNIDFEGGIDGGFLGLYIGDLLTKELFEIESFKIIDKQLLGLNQANSTDPLSKAKSLGLDYLIVGTAYPPDVAEIGTNIPLQDLLGITEDLTDKNLGAKHFSNFKESKLSSIVRLSLRLIDVQSGEIIFIATEMQRSKGISELSLEYGVLSGVELNQGISDFKNSVTGKATNKAIENLVTYVDKYLKGEISNRSYMGNVVNIGANNKIVEEPDLYLSEIQSEGGDFAFEQVVEKGDSVYFIDKSSNVNRLKVGTYMGESTFDKNLVEIKTSEGGQRCKKVDVFRVDNLYKKAEFSEDLIGQEVIFLRYASGLYRGIIQSVLEDKKLLIEFMKPSGKIKDAEMPLEFVLFYK